MLTFKPLELMEKKYSVNGNEYICSGDNGRIYKLNTEKIAKIPYNLFKDRLCNDREAQFNLFREYKKQELAVEMGIKYPRVEGFYAIKENKSGLYFPGLVMDFKDAKTLDQLCGPELREARRQRDIEIEKARDFGLRVTDNHKWNTLWDCNGIWLLDAANLEVAF